MPDSIIINRLARDAELIVAASVLEFSPVLADEDLLDIIVNDPVPGALSAIARRKYVAPAVTNAIVAGNDTVAITHMLKNGNALLQETVLDSLIERSVNNPALAGAADLSSRADRTLGDAAGGVDRGPSARPNTCPQGSYARTIRKVAQVVGERLRQRSCPRRAPAIG